ncbi:MAG: carboxypeptidase-like regulatory domain-containing protein [Bacteroidales bacterium]|nr:carboxypeptidase-like regulatory domain-containing protein [Bacteroidales bacterium]
MMKIIIPLLWMFLTLFNYEVDAGIVKGIVTDMDGKPLPFATVFVKGSTTGTATNPEGVFELNLPEGNHELVFQYVGYKKHIESIHISHEPLILNIKLQTDNITLTEVVISASAEDPAYGIIRNAIKMRKHHLQQVNNYVCDVYTKGIFEMTDAPEMMFGDSLNTENDSILGIFYLSESESIISFQQPDQIKEEMVSSKVSGDDKGFSINFVSFFMMNFYKSKINIPIDRNQRGYISPIANNALFYYKYRLEGTFLDGDHLINKISVIPKRKIDPVFKGSIYIIEDLWAIHSVDLAIGHEAQIDFIDSIRIIKTRVPVEDSIWMTLTRKFQFYFSINFFGKKFAGNGLFHSQNTNYLFNNDFDEKFFKNEIIKVDPDANKKDSMYWEQNRPIPLTSVEIKNYKTEDSLQAVYQSKKHHDSLDKSRNKFKWQDLIWGYNYYRGRDSTTFSIGSPLTTVQFNTVQGWNIRLDMGYARNFSNRKRISVDHAFGYGFSNKRWSYDIISNYFYNPGKFANLTLSAGIKPVQYNANNPISPFLNSLYTLLDENNYMKIYEKIFFKAKHYSELTNGIYLTAGLEYAERKPLVNTTNYKWVNYSSRDYTSNNPQDPDDFTPAFERNQAFIFSASFRFVINQKYISVPQKVVLGSKYPDMILSYEKGISGIFGSDVSYDIVRIGFSGESKFGLIGEGHYHGQFGTFFNNRNMEFMDFHHFDGNRTIITNPTSGAYQLLDYYTYSTNKTFLEAYYEHHFNGFIFNKLPLLRRTKWRAVAGVRYFNKDLDYDYVEINAGIKNIFKIFRVDFVTAFNKGQKARTGVVITIPISDGAITID